MTQARGDLDRALAGQLLDGVAAPVIAHLVGLGLVLVVVWGTLPLSVLVPWVGAVTVVVGGRALLWSRARSQMASPPVVARMVRVSMLALGLAWGIGTAAAARYLPIAYLALLVMALGGLIAASTATLAADRWAFPVYAGAMLVPALIGVVEVVRGRIETVTIALIVLFLAFTVRLHAQAHAVLLQRLQSEENQRTLVRELQAALLEVKTLRGILPICANCKRVRTEAGAWEQIESYVRERTAAEFSHGLCPDCAVKTWG